jgi:hypothetical protein
MLDVEELLELEDNIRKELDDHLPAALSMLNGRLGFAEGIIKTFQNGHGQNHLAVLMGLEQANQMGGNLPDQVGFCADIGIRLLLQFLHGHRFVPPDSLFFTF